MLSKPLRLICICFILAALAGCRAGTAVSPVVQPTAAPGQQTATDLAITVEPTPEPTPTATPEPLALRVNGEGITLAEFEADLAQLQEAQQTLGKTSTPEEQRQRVIDNFIDTLLLAQGAAENGFTMDEAALQAAVANLAEEIGGEQALQEWIARRGYQQRTFEAALRRQAAAAWQRDQIAASVPTEAEQVHARQILTVDESIARTALQQVNTAGANFAAYAYRYDLQTGGDLGWFPRGYLTQQAVEEAAFALQPGEISDLIQSEIGYHIIQVIAREPARPISPDARRVLQHKALESWLAERRAAAQVEILLP